LREKKALEIASKELNVKGILVTPETYFEIFF
jgi:hypothetical protein